METTFEERVIALKDDIAKLPEVYQSNAVNMQAYELQVDGESEVVVLYKRKDLTNLDYTKHIVYDCLSTISHWGKLKRAISACIGDKTIDKSEYDLKYKRNPSFENYLIKHHKYETAHVDGLIDGTVMRYTIIKPYDD